MAGPYDKPARVALAFRRDVLRQRSYVFRNWLDVFFYGRTKRLALFEQTLIVAPIVVGAWALTHTWIALFAVLYAKFLFSMSRVEDLVKGKPEVIDVTRLIEPEEAEVSLLDTAGLAAGARTCRCRPGQSWAAGLLRAHRGGR